jgi:hypothetical protein
MSIQSLAERPIGTPPKPISLAKPPPAARGDEPSAFARLLSSLGKEMQQGERTVKGALAASKGGGDLGATELLALQAGVYRYGEAVDLASRLVDRASTGVKTVLQGQ